MRPRAHILGSAARPAGPGCPRSKDQNIHGRRGMRSIIAIALLSTLFLGAAAFAADAVVGTWKLNVAKSKFSGTAPKSGTRVYSESADGTTLDQKSVGADGKEMSMHVTLTYDGKDHPITGNPDADSGIGKALDAHTTN